MGYCGTSTGHSRLNTKLFYPETMEFGDETLPWHLSDIETGRSQLVGIQVGEETLSSSVNEKNSWIRLSYLALWEIIQVIVRDCISGGFEVCFGTPGADV